jgi:hypothetical protein
MRGILQKDLSVELPKIRVRKDATIPSVWDPELLVRLLKTVDRSSVKGKRDYARKDRLVPPALPPRTPPAKVRCPS